ncbi:MAG: hypothetical protein CL930_16090 [Deltaproteobacteria bacterium]|nr:hypothetical protein [Deltaproteobacteria bacterium]
MLLSLLLSLTVHAADCDAVELSKSIKDATPHEAAPLFVQLAQCDAAAAKKTAKTAIPQLVAESAGFEAAIAAINVGAGESVMDWMATRQQDERSRAVRSYGKQCQESEAIQKFLVDAHGKLGDNFWTERWYRALTECRTDAITGLLQARVDQGPSEDRGLYFAVVEVYAANVGITAVPKLQTLISEESDVETQVNLIQALADAAQAGTVQGLNVKTAAAAAESLKSIVTNLPARAVDQARITLRVLQDEQGSDALVKVRYNDKLQDDEGLLYGAVVFENATCKNGKEAQRYHVAEVLDPGQTWPDQVEEKVKSSVEVSWKLNMAERCKGEGEVLYFTSDVPFKDKSEMKVWVKSVLSKQTKASVKKPVRIDEEPLAI